VRENAAGIQTIAAERVFGELKRVVTAERARSGLELMDAYGLTDVVLPELSALHGVEQNQYHHADVHGHTLEVLRRTIALCDFAEGRTLRESGTAVITFRPGRAELAAMGNDFMARDRVDRIVQESFLGAGAYAARPEIRTLLTASGLHRPR